MSARAWAAAGAVLVLIAAQAVTGPGLPPLARTDRPNLVLIVTDDQRWDSLGQMPNAESLLAGHGVTFSNMFVTTPYCCPSRASIFTGEYSRHTGVLDDVRPDGGATVFDDRSTLATWLHDAGYQTAMVGKYLNDYPSLGTTYLPPGWDVFDAIATNRAATSYYDYLMNENGRLVNYGFQPTDYSTSVLTGLADDFLRRTGGPFFLYFAPIAPHEPAPPAHGDARTLPRQPAPVSFDEPNTSDKPWNGTIPPMSPKQIGWDGQLRERMPETLLAVDRAVAQFVQTIAERGGLGNTVIALTSDNGYLWGEHRITGKLWPYEESIRVPLVVRMPGATSGTTDDHLVLNIDLASTFAELAGVAPGLPQDGTSLVPLLRGSRDPPWRTSFVVEYLGHERFPGTPPDYTGIRTERYLYVRYANGWRELYDLAADPFELVNVAELPENAPLERGLESRLEALLAS